LALSYPDSGTVVLWSGLPAAPKVEATLKIAQFDALAIGDSGALVYTSGNQIFTGDGQFLYESAALGVVAFEAGRDAVVAFDGSNSNLVEVGVGTASQKILAAGVAAPDSLFAGLDRMYAGYAAAGTVSLIEYADGATVSLNVSVSRIVPSGIAGTMIVSYDSAGPAWLVNTQGIAFVPAILKQATNQ
jgi:hypothetical protein